jgi:O-antigen/teichoic acid export membrane protein
MGYTRETIKGISWMVGFRVVTRLISYARLAIILRILSPTQFGLFVIASIVLAFIEILIETGINTFLIQEEDEIDTYVNTAWIVSIVRGAAIALMIIAAASSIAQFFNAVGSYTLLLLISIVPFVRGFINPAIIKFQKDLDFHKEFYFRTFLFLVDTSVAVVVTYITRSAEGIIWGLIAGAFLEVILSFVLIRPTPKFIFQMNLLKRVINRGKWMTAAGVFNYLFHNGDDIVVGKLLGTLSLGLYDFAYKFSMLPITEVGDVVSKVTFPVYTKIAHDAKRLKTAYLKTLAATTILVMPIGLILFLFPHEIILFFGPQWSKAASIFQILAVFGVIRAILNTASPLFLAVKKQEYVTSVTLISFLVLAFTIIPFVKKFGISGAGFSVLTATFFTIPFIQYYLFKTFKDINKNS